ncbi:MAG: phosphomevalonate kinase [Myxococcaceae bacterium]
MAFPERTLSAPGKLFVSGEYAVLWGGVSRVLAVAPRTHALVRGRSDRVVELVLEDGRLTGTATPAGVRWDAEVTAPYRFAAITLDHALRISGREGPGFSIAFEPSPLIDGHKLGLGSSARATVLAAEAARVALDASFDSLKVALLAHADAQGGKGSGGDVAASFAGGLVRYRRYDVAPLVKASAKGGLVALLDRAAPVDLARVGEPVYPLVYVFSGESSSTPSLIRAIEARLSADARREFVEKSDHHGDLLEKGLVRRDFGAIEASCEELQALLWSLGDTRHEALERIIGLARTFGCVAKQSGAGGGDGAIAFCPDAAAQRELIAACTARGLHAFAVAASAGLQGEVKTHPALAAWL